MKIKAITTAIALVVFAGSTALAQTKTTTHTKSASSSRRSGASTDDSMGTGSNRSVASRYSTTTNRAGWLPSISLDFGHMDQSGNSDADGDALTVAAIATWYAPDSNWIADGGLGVKKHYFRGNQPTAGLVTLSGRYEFPKRYSIGPVVDFMFGTTEDFGSANNYYTMAGVQGFKEITLANDQLIRLGLKFTTQFGISDQTSNFFGLVAQWGVGSANTMVRSNVSMNED